MSQFLKKNGKIKMADSFDGSNLWKFWKKWTALFFAALFSFFLEKLLQKTTIWTNLFRQTFAKRTLLRIVLQKLILMVGFWNIGKISLKCGFSGDGIVSDEQIRRWWNRADAKIHSLDEKKWQNEYLTLGGDSEGLTMDKMNQVAIQKGIVPNSFFRKLVKQFDVDGNGKINEQGQLFAFFWMNHFLLTNLPFGVLSILLRFCYKKNNFQNSRIFKVVGLLFQEMSRFLGFNLAKIKTFQFLTLTSKLRKFVTNYFKFFNLEINKIRICIWKNVWQQKKEPVICFCIFFRQSGRKSTWKNGNRTIQQVLKVEIGKLLEKSPIKHASGEDVANYVGFLPGFLDWNFLIDSSKKITICIKIFLILQISRVVCATFSCLFFFRIFPLKFHPWNSFICFLNKRSQSCLVFNQLPPSFKSFKSIHSPSWQPPFSYFSFNGGRRS